MRNHILLSIILLLFISAFAVSNEPVCHFRHYSTEDGLPQYTIMDMLQDKKGFMWFGTWDGLSQFDGYRFKNYKVKLDDTYIMKSSRVERLFDDKFGRIWFNTYDGDYHCFNPDSRTFWNTQLITDVQKNSFKTSKIEVKPSGNVWMLSDKNGCILVKDSLFSTQIFNIASGGIKSECINSVLEDKDENSWLLTNNGICFIDKENLKPTSYFYESENIDIQQSQSFYSALDLGKMVLFGSQNGRIWQYSKQNSKFTLIQSPVSANIKRILQLNATEILLITNNSGFLIYNSKSKQFKSFNTSNLKELGSNEIYETFLIKNRYLWFDTPDVGIYAFDTETYKLKFYITPSNDPATVAFPPKTIVFEDVNDKLWIQPKGGGFSQFNKQTKELEPFFNSRKSGNWKFSNILHSACSDRQGNLWMCTRSHGLEKVIFDRDFFNDIIINTDNNTVSANEVRAVFEDTDRNLWVGTKDYKVTVFDSMGNKLGSVSEKGEITKNAKLPAIVYCITQDTDGKIWLGTKGKGIYCLSKTKGKLKYNAEHYIRSNSDVYSLSDNSIYSIFQDSKGKVWVGTYGGGLNLVAKNTGGKTIFINHRNNLKNFPSESANRLRYITENKQGKICLGSTGGLIMFSMDFSDPENIQYKTYSRKAGDINSLNNNDVHGIYVTKNGDMYLATYGGGLNKVTEFDKNGFPLKFKSFTTKDGLPSDVTLAVREDEFGKLWISNENNLSKFDPEKEVFENFAEVKRIMSTNKSFSEASTCRLQNNDLVFGYTEGLLRFSPRSIIISNYKPCLVLSNLQIFNKNVEIGEPGSPLQHDINNIEKLTLTHKQNFINIEYAALDFVDPEYILYAYKLDGFDKEWNYVQKQRIANYTNLPKGNYVFRVKSTNNEGAWVDNERTLSIEVLPSFWESIWAYLLYFVLFVGLILLIVRILITFYRLRANVSFEKKMSEMKLRFFTDISHEIRTPLTMITGPVDYLLNDNKTPSEIKKHLKTISQNTYRMLRLVNQILDFRKIQSIQLKIQQVDIVDFIEKACSNFSEIADEQHIRFEFINKTKIDKIWIDADCLEKIVMNLLSNAFKFTSANKSITVTLYSDEKCVFFEVHDEGCGISKERQKNLFVRFASFNEDKSKPSTGIGLSMVKDLADKLSAKITVNSEVGKGSTFTVSFLQGLNHYDKNTEIITGTTEKINENSCNDNLNAENDMTSEDSTNQTADNKISILIVEDNDELREFIKTVFGTEYHIYEASDGIEGWDMAVKHTPDIVVSDIMMPRMDGIELLQKIKTDIHTSHIPVVLLTAKTNIESKLEGLSYGADDYITKPFNVTYFKARIANLVQQRKQLQEYFRTQLVPNTTIDFHPEPYSITSHDEEMMKKIMSLIEGNMENNNFSVEELGQCVQMSRSVFFKKLKGLTGLAPVEFIRDIKMKRAAQILSSGEYMVKEVAYLVGISDTKYFAKCFKAKYGKTPLEFKNEYREENSNETE